MTNDELRTKFNPEGSDLRNLQLRMLSILDEIDRICRDHGIDYWLTGGTLIGAVRHGGFIPWDDDIDIKMTIEGYKKFLEIAPSCLPPHLVIQNHDTDKYYFFRFGKVRDLRSKITELTGVDRFYKYKGAFVDIFPCGSYSKTLYTIAWFLQINCLIRPAKYIPWKWFHTLLIGVNHVVGKIYGLFNRIEKIKHSKGVLNAYGTHDKFIDIPEDSVFPVKDILFEGKRFLGPADPDRYLRLYYGDYMRLPDLDKIETHALKIELYEQ